ncbi:MAG: molybdopterin-dependent oxidoreductase, partial [Pseudomonadota bacterium]|nr:molybdopterin-dependent oxidoreductase [Pseudomonadota bacterium]
GASDAGLIPMFYPDYKSVEAIEQIDRYRQFWDHEPATHKGLTVVEITDAMAAGTIKGLYIMGENPAMSDPDQGHTRAALARLEHLVVQDLFLTETAAFADVILPASAFPEKDGTFTNTDRRVQRGRQVMSPPGEARQDWIIIQELARRLGLDWDYREVREIFDEMRQVMPSLTGITWDRLAAEGAVTYPCADEHSAGAEVIFGDGFPTADGRAKFVPATIIPPDEEPDADFPLVLSTGRVLEHWHTGAMTRRAGALDALEPEAFVEINPDDLSRLGLVAGDQVRVSTRRGSIELMARADHHVPLGLVFIPFCFVEAPANILTNPALDPFGKIPELKFAAARVEPCPAAAAE